MVEAADTHATPPTEPHDQPRAGWRRLDPGTRVILEQLGGMVKSPQLVLSTEISATVIWFDFDRFVFFGTPASLVLKTPGKFMRLRGSVATCECHESGRFCVGVKLNERIDVAEMLGDEGP